MLKVAAVIPLIFLVYQVIIDWVNLFPWNDIYCKTNKLKIKEFLINYPPLLLISYAYCHPATQTILWGMLGSIFYFIGHIRAWWIPYFFGASEKEFLEYKKYFERTYKFLPPIKTHPVPDAEHIVLGAICLCMTILNITLFFTF